jgi:hypothetical protein
MPPRRKLTKGGVVAAVWAALLIPLAVYATDWPQSFTDVVNVVDQATVRVLHTLQVPVSEVATVIDQATVNVLHTFQKPVSETVSVGDGAVLTVLHTYPMSKNETVGIGDSASVVFVVRATTTTLSSTANPSTYGAAITLTATITASTNPGTNEGTVDFIEGDAVLCSKPLTGNIAMCSITPNAGSHAYTAYYSGTSRYAVSSDRRIQQVNAASLTVAADSKSRVYGALNPAFTATITGFVNGETLGTSGVNGSPSCTTAATATSSVVASPYSIACAQGSLIASNYTFTFVPGSLTVTRAPLTVTADPKSRVYGAANPPLTATIAGFVNGETLSTSGVSGRPSCSTAAMPASAVATSPYTITCASGTLTASNYSFGLVDGSLVVTKAVLTVTADNQSRPYKTANPFFTATITGFVNGEALATSGVSGSASCTTTAVLTSPVSGSPYPITCSMGTLAASNYSFTFVSGSLTIVKADQTISFPALLGQLFGSPPFVVSATADSGLSVSFAAAGQCTVAGSTVTITGGGSCSITARQPGDGNYNAAAPVTRTFNIPCFPSQMVFGLPGTLGTVAPATLTLGSQQPVVGGGCTGNFALTVSIGPFTIPVGTGTFTAATSGIVATARLQGTLTSPPTPFTATLTLDTAAQTGTIAEVLATEGGPVTIYVTFARSGGGYVITGTRVTP